MSKYSLTIGAKTPGDLSRSLGSRGGWEAEPEIHVEFGLDDRPVMKFRASHLEWYAPGPAALQGLIDSANRLHRIEQAISEGYADRLAHDDPVVKALIYLGRELGGEVAEHE